MGNGGSGGSAGSGGANPDGGAGGSGTGGGMGGTPADAGRGGAGGSGTGGGAPTAGSGGTGGSGGVGGLTGTGGTAAGGTGAGGSGRDAAAGSGGRTGGTAAGGSASGGASPTGGVTGSGGTGRGGSTGTGGATQTGGTTGNPDGGTTGVVACPDLPGATKSPLYSVTANGTALFVEKMTKFSPEMQVHYAHASLSGGNPVTIAVTVSESFSSYKLSPKSRQIAATKSGNTVTFSSGPNYLIFQPDTKELLFILLDAEEANPPKLGDANVKNLADYDVDNTGATLVTSKIQSAINAASGATQNILYVPPGKYKVGELWLKSNMTMYLACGAILYGSSSTGDFNTGSGGINIEGMQHSLIRIYQAKNTKLLGRGVLDANGHAIRAAGLNASLHEDRAELEHHGGRHRGERLELLEHAHLSQRPRHHPELQDDQLPAERTTGTTPTASTSTNPRTASCTTPSCTPATTVWPPRTRKRRGPSTPRTSCTRRWCATATRSAARLARRPWGRPWMGSSGGISTW